jgi:acetyl-CoA carboxylase beta subunit
MSFYVDTDLKVKRLFDSWMATIQDPITRNYNYYDRYTTNMTIEVQDLKDKTRYSIDLYEVYPKTMSSVTLDYSAKDVMKFNVTMQYRYWVSSGKTTLPNDAIVTNNSIDLFSRNFSGFQDSFSTGSLGSFSGLGNGISIDRGIISTTGLTA